MVLDVPDVPGVSAKTRSFAVILFDDDTGTLTLLQPGTRICAVVLLPGGSVSADTDSEQ